MGPTICYHSVPSPLSGKPHDVLHALRQRGARIQLESAPLGILLFEEDHDRVLAVAAEAARTCTRVLAVGVGADPPGALLVKRMMLAGIADVYWWDESARAVDGILDRLARWHAIEEILASPLVLNHLVGTSRAWTTALRRLIEVALFSSGPCLLLGESGTGKELAAKLIHTLDTREMKSGLVVVDCSTIVAELSGSEFFGHERGAYTNAYSRRDGAFALADGGTLFLDEAGELPLSLQAQLLRVIQEGTYKPVGGNEWRRTAFRLVSATNRDISRDVALGRFRGDLYYRMAGASVHLPALRERREDILSLALHFAAALLPHCSSVEFDDAVKSYLLAREYHGNVRELRQIVTRMCERHCGGGPVTLGDIAEEDRLDPGVEPSWDEGAFEQCIRRAVLEGVSLKEIGRKATDRAIQVAIDDARGNLARAARRLGVTDRALQIRRAVQRENGSPAVRARSAGA